MVANRDWLVGIAFTDGDAKAVRTDAARAVICGERAATLATSPERAENKPAIGLNDELSEAPNCAYMRAADIDDVDCVETLGDQASIALGRL